MAVVAESSLVLHHVKHRIEVGDFFLDGGNCGFGNSRLLRKGCNGFCDVVVCTCADVGEAWELVIGIGLRAIVAVDHGVCGRGVE